MKITYCIPLKIGVDLGRDLARLAFYERSQGAAKQHELNSDVIS